MLNAKWFVINTQDGYTLEKAFASFLEARAYALSWYETHNKLSRNFQGMYRVSRRLVVNEQVLRDQFDYLVNG